MIFKIPQPKLFYNSKFVFHCAAGLVHVKKSYSMCAMWVLSDRVTVVSREHTRGTKCKERTPCVRKMGWVIQKALPEHFSFWLPHRNSVFANKLKSSPGSECLYWVTLTSAAIHYVNWGGCHGNLLHKTAILASPTGLSDVEPCGVWDLLWSQGASVRYVVKGSILHRHPALCAIRERFFFVRWNPQPALPLHGKHHPRIYFLEDYFLLHWN